MASGPTEPNSRTDPSDGPVATYWWAMLPPAPALFSMTTVKPVFSASFLPMMRAAVSAAPPAAKPTTTVSTRLAGRSWAAADAGWSRAGRAASAASKGRRFTGSPVLGGWSVGTQADGVGQALLDRMAQQRRAAVQAVGELAAGQGGEQGRDRAQVGAQQPGYGRAAAAQPQRQARGRGQRQQRDEAQVHRPLVAVAMQGVPAQVQPAQAQAAQQQADAADHPQQLGQRGQGVGRRPPQGVVVQRRHRGRREARQKAIEGQVVEAPAGK